MVESLVEAKADVNAPPIKQDWYSSSPLCEAAELGHLRVLTRLLELGADPNTGKHGPEALFRACAHGRADMARVLLASGARCADTHGDAFTALHFAALAGSVEVVQLLLTHGVGDVNRRSEHNSQVMGVPGTTGPRVASSPALVFAAAAGHLRVVDCLVRVGNANVHACNGAGHNALMEACARARVEMAKELVDRWGARVRPLRKSISTPLSCAAKAGSVELVRFLLERNADVHAHYFLGVGALLGAAEEGHTDVVRCLVEHKADLHAGTSGGCYGDVASEAPLVAAVEGAHVNTVRALVELKADAHVQDSEGNTLVMRAVQGRSIGSAGERAQVAVAATVRALLELGLSVNAPTRTGLCTPLIAGAAVANGDGLVVVQALLDGGADVDAGDWEGKTALVCAEESEWLDERSRLAVLQRLLEARASANALNAEGDSILVRTVRGRKPFRVAILRMLLESRADVDAVCSRNGHTALLECLARRDLAAVRVMLAFGADVHACDAHGTGAVEGVIRSPHPGEYGALLGALLDAGAVFDDACVRATLEQKETSEAPLLRCVLLCCELEGQVPWQEKKALAMCKDGEERETCVLFARRRQVRLGAVKEALAAEHVMIPVLADVVMGYLGMQISADILGYGGDDVS